MEQLEHPQITNALRTGWPDGKKPEYPKCPVCGQDCGELFKDILGNVLGCDECVRPTNAWEAPECFPEK